MEDDLRRMRCGKRALKYSLVRRRKYGPYGMDGYSDGYIESMRRGVDEFGLSAKTHVDDICPELMVKATATLGRAQRWSDVKALFQQLEQEGIAVRVAANRRQDCRRFDWYSIPQDIERYVVKPNGTFQKIASYAARWAQKSSACHNMIHRWQRGALSIWYELTSEPPSCIEAPPLHGSLRAAPNTPVLHGAACRAFSPGVATSCGAASTVENVCAAQRAVAEEAIDLVFGRSVSVTYASLAGKIHDTTLEVCRDDELGMKTSRYNRRATRRKHMALERTEAYCDRVKISARLSSNPREWLSLGVFEGCRDGHTEKPIFLGDCGTGGAVHCIALRFRAVSWHNRPYLRVGAYGFDDRAKKKSQKIVHKGEADLQAGVEYVLHYSKNRDDGNDGFRRKYGVKQGKSYRWSFQEPKDNKARKRSQLKSAIDDALT